MSKSSSYANGVVKVNTKEAAKVNTNEVVKFKANEIAKSKSNGVANPRSNEGLEKTSYTSQRMTRTPAQELDISVQLIKKAYVLATDEERQNEIDRINESSVQDAVGRYQLDELEMSHMYKKLSMLVHPDRQS